MSWRPTGAVFRAENNSGYTVPAVDLKVGYPRRTFRYLAVGEPQLGSLSRRNSQPPQQAGGHYGESRPGIDGRRNGLPGIGIGLDYRHCYSESSHLVFAPTRFGWLVGFSYQFSDWTHGPIISTDWITAGFTGAEPSPPGWVGAVAMASMASRPATVCPKMV